MGVERIIGIDFGTSTSVIRVKRYKDGQSVGDPLEVKQITFDLGSTMVPTLVQKRRNNGETVYFGYDANVPHKDTSTFSNFKIDLENPDPEIRQQAKELTSEFFAYMAKIYKAQSDGGHLGESSDQEHTIISYPVKWSEETKAFMQETAKAAGFPNVEELDEARAAIQAVTVQNADMLRKKGYFKDGIPTTILLIDMGAGTTDLVLCRHTPGGTPKTEILRTWPQSGNTLFGGSEVDKILRNMIGDCLPEDSVDMILRKLNTEKFKTWKERNISPALSKKESVEEFSALDEITDLLGIDVSYSVNRKSFETAATEYLQEFPKLINDCLKNGNLTGNDVDLVILTGGHSQWYFVQEMLQGKMNQFGAITLAKIQKDNDRVVPISLPQETVALGLVYGKMVPRFENASTKQSSISSTSVNKNGINNVSKVMSQELAVNSLKERTHGAAVFAADDLTIGLRSDGTVVATGDNTYGQCNVNDWHDIIAVSSSGTHTVGLKSDGTVVATGLNSETITVEEGFFITRRIPRTAESGACNVSNWHDIIAIATSEDTTYGVMKNGALISTVLNDLNIRSWREPTRDPDIKRGWHEVARGWDDVIAITQGVDNNLFGLRKNGTLVAFQRIESQEKWNNLVAISSNQNRLLGLKNDGTIIYTRCHMEFFESMFKQLRNLRNIAGISATIGCYCDEEVITCVKKDGSVFSVNYEGEHPRCEELKLWNNIIMVSSSKWHTVGLKDDGTVVATGANNKGQCNVQSWKLF